MWSKVPTSARNWGYDIFEEEKLCFGSIRLLPGLRYAFNAMKVSAGSDNC